MNRFEQAYLNIINEWNNNLLLEANLKSLIPYIQSELLQGKEYKDLTDIEKEDLNVIIKSMLDQIEQNVYKITDNKQYQSWIYNILKNKEVSITDLTPIKSVLIDFIKLCKRPDLKPEQKNIQNYSTLNSLKEFVDSFKEEHKLQNNIYKNLKKVYNNEEFTIYFINKNQYLECNKLFGGNEYFNTGWCVAKNFDYFTTYINDSKDKYNGYFVFIKDNKPYALLHYGSGQFKDTSDETLHTNNPNIIDCLMYINNNLKFYTKKDLIYYGEYLFMKDHPNACKEDFIAFEIGGEYNKETKTIDCKGKKIKFNENWLDENGTFDFNFINATDNWSEMFFMCRKLIKLPNNFTIPNGVINCSDMFDECKNLTELPENFTIPNSVINCRCMFTGCINLTKLPDNFKLSKNTENSIQMFNFCETLKQLPNGFSLPNTLIYCTSMFANCYQLNKLSDNFTIPNSVDDCKYMFYKCYSLNKLPEKFSIPMTATYTDIFFRITGTL